MSFPTKLLLLIQVLSLLDLVNGAVVKSSNESRPSNSVREIDSKSTSGLSVHPNPKRPVSPLCVVNDHIQTGRVAR